MHNGMDLQTLKSALSRFLFRVEILGTYIDDEPIAFTTLAFAGNDAPLGQISSDIAYRDKAPNKVLIAKALLRL